MWNILEELTASCLLQSVVRLSKVLNHYSLCMHRQESTNLLFDSVKMQMEILLRNKKEKSTGYTTSWEFQRQFAK